MNWMAPWRPSDLIVFYRWGIWESEISLGHVGRLARLKLEALWSCGSELLRCLLRPRRFSCSADHEVHCISPLRSFASEPMQELRWFVWKSFQVCQSMVHWNRYFGKLTLLGFPRVASKCSGDDISDKVLLHQFGTGSCGPCVHGMILGAHWSEEHMHRLLQDGPDIF